MARDGTTGLLESTAILRGTPLEALLNGGERLLHPRIDRGVIKFVFTVVRQEKLQALPHERIVDRLAAERALNQNWSAITHIAGNHVIGQRRPSDVAQRGVHGVHQIEARINQRAIEIEDHQLDRVRVKGAAGLDHALSG